MKCTFYNLFLQFRAQRYDFFFILWLFSMKFFVRYSFLPIFAPEIKKETPSKGLCTYQKEQNDKETTGFIFVCEHNAVCQ